MPLSAPRLLTALPAHLLAGVLVAAVLVVLLPAPSRAELPVEGYPRYQPQTRCSPTAKPGTLALAEHLLARYPGSGSSGISRSCGASGISEHKEGRAFDWRLSVGSSRDRGYARDFLGRILATDRRGNRQALARRMGIMYVIWNDRIWSGTDGYRPRDYLHSACRKLRTCPTSLRHRDHMHISLTWAGARGRTSWYQRRGGSSRPAKAPTGGPTGGPATRPGSADDTVDLRRTRYAKVSVPVTGRSVRTPFSLAKGETYTVTAAGLYSYGGPTDAGDAVCTWSADRAAWVARPSARTAARHGRLALLVNGRRIFGNECRPATHVYRARYTARSTGPLTLGVPGRHGASTGALTVVVSRTPAAARPGLPTYPALSAAPTADARPLGGYGLLAETVTLDPGRASHTLRSLDAGARYRVTVRGVARLGRGVLTDGRCVSVRDRWYRSASLDLRAPGAEHGRLYLDGVPFAGRSLSGGGCGDGGYTVDHTPTRDGRLRLELWDPLDRGDNEGTLTVQVQRLTGFAAPRPARSVRPQPRSHRHSAPWTQVRDWFEVRSDAPAGTVSSMRLRKGEVVQVVVRGTQRSHGREADAACVRTEAGWSREDADLAVALDPLELWVDGAPVAWRAIGPTTQCSETERNYTVRFTARKHGPLRLAVLDLDHRDNVGVLSVTLLRTRG